MNQLVALFRQADNVLRRGSSLTPAQPRGWASSLGNSVLLILAFGMFYGGLMGTYGGVGGERIWQVVYSGVKVPLLLMATFLLSLPSFFVLNTLLGLRGDFARVVASLLATQAGLTVILASLAPVTAFWYVSGSGYQQAILFNGMMFAVASISAAVAASPRVPSLDRPSPGPPLDAPDLDRHLRLRRHSDGLGAAPLHRQPPRTSPVLPRG